MYKTLWKAYQNVLQNYPITTKSSISGSLFTLGDYISQRGEQKQLKLDDQERKLNYDKKRGLQMLLFGTFINGPVMHAWYRQLDILVPRSGFRACLTKLAWDQLIFAPLYYCGFYTCSTAYKELVGKNQNEVSEGQKVKLFPETQKLGATSQVASSTVNQLKNTLIPTMIMDFKVWPAANYINLTFVPPQHRVLFDNLVSVGWNAYLSNMAHGREYDQANTQSSNNLTRSTNIPTYNESCGGISKSEFVSFA
eukprot:gb/GECH01011513.1/.p1 GENE.gb/GECH01011513.1/~~gb/GECH01011513.1/.p1  ORF type:complete len:252 (+),score=52.66 gb/GECH01011513.1/:1-756(+)